jgi:hypothetical protein
MLSDTDCVAARGADSFVCGETALLGVLVSEVPVVILSGGLDSLACTETTSGALVSVVLTTLSSGGVDGLRITIAQKPPYRRVVNTIVTMGLAPLIKPYSPTG